jgi:hypothetical protein
MLDEATAATAVMERLAGDTPPLQGAHVDSLVMGEERGSRHEKKLFAAAIHHTVDCTGLPVCEVIQALFRTTADAAHAP